MLPVKVIWRIRAINSISKFSFHTRNTILNCGGIFSLTMFWFWYNMNEWLSVKVIQSNGWNEVFMFKTWCIWSLLSSQLDKGEASEIKRNLKMLSLFSIILSNQKGISIQQLSNACPSFCFCACLYFVEQMPSFVKCFMAKWLSWWEIVFCKAQSSQNNESDGIWFLSCLLLFAPRPIMSVIGK